MFKWMIVVLASICFGQFEAKIIRKAYFDPPTNPLHFVKLTKMEKLLSNSNSNDNQIVHELTSQMGLKHEPLKPRKQSSATSRWDAHDPGYYTDAFARNIMLPLSAAAYSEDPSGCLRSKLNNAKVSFPTHTQK